MTFHDCDWSFLISFNFLNYCKTAFLAMFSDCKTAFLARFSNYETVFIVTFETTEDVRAFLGGTPNPDIPLQEFDFALHVNSDNSKILHSNGFYDSVSLGDKITVTVSSWIYMDGDFFYIAQLECDGTEYLTFDEGLKNIVDMMNKNKSLF